MKLFHFLAITSPLALFASPAQAIIFGQLVNKAEYPAKSTVMLLQAGAMNTGKGICSGTLVAEDLVITAAHCVVNFSTKEDLAPKSLKIYFGNYDGENWDSSLLREVQDFRRHEGYTVEATQTLALVHDIALLKLSVPAPEIFSPAAVLKDPSAIFRNQKALIAGFGNTLFAGDPKEPKSRLLRSFAVIISNPRQEVSGMIEYSRHPIDNIQTIEDYQNAVGGMAGGDSGGPAFTILEGKPFLIGVASGYRFEDERPSYENVPTHADWLSQAAKNMGASMP